jgi:transcriptional regulator with XRE-family HTH domain
MGQRAAGRGVDVRSNLGRSDGRGDWSVKREIEHRWRELGEYVREQRRQGQLSLRHLSELSGVSNPYLSQIERGLRRPSAGVLQQLARALHISAETLYVRAGMLDDEREGPIDDLVEAIRRSSELDEDQKRSLVHIYESFRAERVSRLERAARQPRATRPPRVARTARARRAARRAEVAATEAANPDEAVAAGEVVDPPDAIDRSDATDPPDAAHRPEVPPSPESPGPTSPLGGPHPAAGAAIVSRTTSGAPGESSPEVEG